MTKEQTRALIYLATLLTNTTSVNRFGIRQVEKGQRIVINCYFDDVFAFKIYISQDGKVMYVDSNWVIGGLADCKEALGYDIWSLQGRQL
jgi:hypothetical protein